MSPRGQPLRYLAVTLGCLCTLVGCAGELAKAPGDDGSPSASQTTASASTRSELPQRVERASEEARSEHDEFEIVWNAESPNPAVDVRGLTQPQREALQKADWSRDEWTGLLAVYVGSEPDADTPAVLGRYEIMPDGVRFTPRFSFEPGLTYVAVFHPDRLPGAAAVSGAPLVRTLAIPDMPAVEPTVVEQVFPTRNTLPENLLKFYLHFSAPMSQGDVYQYIHVIDAMGNEIDYPFLRLEQELWDPTGTRLTVLFDPGRIKRGLKPREEVGPVFEEGKKYTLLIDRDWPDAAGHPLKTEFRKTFRIVAPDETQPDPQDWTIHPPPAETRDPLQVRFNEPLDHAMLNRVLAVTNSDGEHLAGNIDITQEETRWKFRPEEPWQPGQYELLVETTLEDLAGNSIGRPFEVDVFETIQRTVEREMVSLPFHVKRLSNNR